jgi:hypothetical protein
VSANESAWIISDGTEGRPLPGLAALETALDTIHRSAHSRPRLVKIVSPAGAELLIALGSGQSVLQFAHGADPPCLVSVGDSDAQGVEAFDYEGCETEIERRHLISTEGARHAAARFYETGELPTNLRWEEI